MKNRDQNNRRRLSTAYLVAWSFAPRDGSVRALRPRRAKRLARVLAVVTILLAATIGGTHTTLATFASSTTNPANAFATGTVVITDDDSGTALVNATGLQRNDSVTSCLKVTYTGSVASTVRLYGSTSGALAPYVTMTVTRGTSSGTFPSCTGFTPDATTYIGGQAAGVIWTGNLNSYPTTYAGGVIDPPTGASTWTTNTTRAYRVQFTIQDNMAASNTSSAATLTWEARDS